MGWSWTQSGSIDYETTWSNAAHESREQLRAELRPADYTAVPNSAVNDDCTLDYLGNGLDSVQTLALCITGHEGLALL